MEKHYELTDAEFEKQFSDCSFDPEVFSHEAHLRLAWIHLDKYGLQQAQENIQSQLFDFVKHVGASDKYHKTLTIVAVGVVNHFMKKSKTDNFKNFITEFPQLKNDFKRLINSHYSFDVFQSEKAKNIYLKPDLSPIK